MSDHYKTLGLQPNASKSDIKNAYFRLAHRYHPDHHAKADAAGRAAAAALFRKAKDAYEVLYDDGRRAAYDRTIRSSSSASSRQHGQYGSSSSSSRASSTGHRSQHGQYSSMDEMLEDLQRLEELIWEYKAQSTYPAISNSAEWATEWAALLERARRTRRQGGTVDWEAEIVALPQRVEQRRQGHGTGAYSNSSAYRNHGQHGQYGASPRSSARGSRQQGYPRPPWPRRFAGVLAGSALIWYMYNKRAKRKEK